MLLTKKFWKDVLIGTIFIFAFMWLASKALAIFSFLDPVGDALGDMQITDQVFSNPNLRLTPPPEDRVTIVNFGRLGRRDIAELVNTVNKYEPRVVGMDTYFRTLKEDTLGDLLLADALSKVENLVLATKLTDPGELEDPHYYDSWRTHELMRNNAEEGHVNLITESAGTSQEELKIVRTFFPIMTLNDTISGEITEYMSLGLKLAEYVDAEAVQEFLDRNIEEEIINFRGDIFDIQNLQQSKYFAIDWMDLLDENFDPELIRDKIVVFGMLGEQIGDKYWIEDKFFTPMNLKYAGRADLDMFGVVIHANVISMVLNRDYIDKMKPISSIIIGIILCFINVVMFTLVYRKLPLWYDGLTKLMQLLELMIILFVIVLGFHWFSYQMELTLGIVAIALAGDALEVLFGVGYNIFDSKKRKLLFTTRQ